MTMQNDVGQRAASPARAQKPLVLAPNLIDHFYRGGARIAALRGISQSSPFEPEEWLAATVSRADSAEIGLTRTVDGSLLRDLVATAPTDWIGESASTAHPADVGVLVKLLDAGQRLPVHVHPTREFARTHLDCPYGKTEAWLVLESDPGAAVHLGWRVPVDRVELDRRRDAQDSEWMLDHMHRVEVSPGMGILVPAGTPHAIDAGIFVTEVQEPTDFSILLEWSATTSTREESHLGRGFETAMATVDVDPLSPRELEQLIVRHDLASRAGQSISLLPAAADPYFRLVLASPAGGAAVGIPGGFAVALVTAGSGTLSGAVEQPIRAGDVLAVPAGFGDWEVRGDASVLIASPGVGWPRSLSTGSIR